MKPMYTPEQRQQYPTYIWFIKTKDWLDMVCDPDLCETLVTSLNSKGLIWSDLYQKTIHAFNIEYIEKVKVKDQHRQLIDWLANRQKELSQENTLSFTQSLQWIKSQNQFIN